MHMTSTAAAIGLRRLRQLRLKFSRPPDFLAEMLKSDQHMVRVKERLAAEKTHLEAFEEKKLRKLNKKFNRLSGHQLVKEQEEARRRNIALKEIEAWKKKRRESALKETESSLKSGPPPSSSGGGARASREDDQTDQKRARRKRGQRDRGGGGEEEDGGYVDAETSFDAWVKRHDERVEEEKRERKILNRRRMKGLEAKEEERRKGGLRQRRRKEDSPKKFQMKRKETSEGKGARGRGNEAFGARKGLTKKFKKTKRR